MCIDIQPVFLLHLVKPKDRYQPVFFFLSCGGRFSKMRTKCGGSYCHVSWFHEVATLVHPIESSKRAARVHSIRSVVQLEVPRL